ncbi:MAG: hypothetical protein ABII22_05270 [Candidatus Micrarchaeota archaeon]
MRKLMLIFAVILLMLFGCVKMNITQKLETDGSSMVTVVMDMKKLIELSPDAATTNPCETQEMPPETTCNYADGVMTMTQKGDATKYKFTAENGLIENKYRFEIDFSELSKTASATGGSTSGMDPSSLNTAEGKEQIAQLKSMGVEMTYTVEMPGEVILAEGAMNKTGSKATFDLLDMFAGSTTDKIVVESKIVNTTMIVAGLVGLVGLILVLLKVMKKI